MIFATTKERLLIFLNSKCITVPVFLKETGIKRGFLDGDKLKGAVSDNFLAKIIANYPELNIYWLLTGEGGMLKQTENPEIKKPPSISIKPKGDVLKSQMTQIDENEPQISVYKLRTDYYGVERQQIPLYEIEASAGLSTLFSSDIKQIPLDFITVPNAPKCDGAVFVRGDSMYPILKAGDIVCYKSLFNIDSVYYGEMYLIDVDMDGDQYLTFKYVQKSEKGDDHVCLVSHNTHHAPKDILKSDIRAIALVKLSIRYNTNS